MQAHLVQVNSKKSKFSTAKRFLLAVDIYGRPFQFNMMHDYETHRSVLGACFSIILFLLTTVYAVSQADILINHK